MRVTEMLGRHVRVYDAQASRLFVEGEVVAGSEEPTIGVRDRNGVIHWHVVSLPIQIQIQTWEQISGRPIPPETEPT